MESKFRGWRERSYYTKTRIVRKSQANAERETWLMPRRLPGKQNGVVIIVSKYKSLQYAQSRLKYKLILCGSSEC